MQPLKTFQLFISPLEQNKIKYFITGSLASMYYGEPRLTMDIDVVVHLSPEDVEKLPTLFPEDQYYCPPSEVIHIECKREMHGHFNLIHPESGFKADIYPISNDPLYRWAFQHLRREDMGNGILVWIAPPEYVIIRKLEYYHEGGSEKHLRDIQGMLPQIEQQLDRKYLESELTHRGFLQHWDKLQARRS